MSVTKINSNNTVYNISDSSLLQNVEELTTSLNDLNDKFEANLPNLSTLSKIEKTIGIEYDTSVPTVSLGEYEEFTNRINRIVDVLKTYGYDLDHSTQGTIFSGFTCHPDYALITCNTSGEIKDDAEKIYFDPHLFINGSETEDYTFKVYKIDGTDETEVVYQTTSSGEKYITVNDILSTNDDASASFDNLKEIKIKATYTVASTNEEKTIEQYIPLKKLTVAD